MKHMNRRNFIKAGAVGLAGMSIIHSGLANTNLTFQQNAFVDKVKLGNTGLTDRKSTRLNSSH